jgi:hypothetical protein
MIYVKSKRMDTRKIAYFWYTFTLVLLLINIILLRLLTVKNGLTYAIFTHSNNCNKWTTTNQKSVLNSMVSNWKLTNCLKFFNHVNRCYTIWIFCWTTAQKCDVDAQQTAPPLPQCWWQTRGMDSQRDDRLFMAAILLSTRITCTVNILVKYPYCTQQQHHCFRSTQDKRSRELNVPIFNALMGEMKNAS